MLAFTSLAGTAGEGRKDDLEVVPAVDLSRYAGQWYEIARLPNRFQKKCADSVTANYTLRADGSIQVVNRCRKTSGEFTTATGKAKIVDKKTNAKLKVTFFWPFYGKYWILDLGPNYEYAVVGEPGRDYHWILSRTPQIDEALYRQLLAKMQARGFDTTRMLRTAHHAISMSDPRLSASDLHVLTGAPWIGTLTYLDYRTNKRVSIASNLKVSQLKGDATAWVFEYQYPHEPKANSQETVTISAEGGIINGERVTERASLDGKGLRFVTEKSGMDNNKEALFRFTYVISANSFSIKKEVRYVGAEEYIERNQYDWKR
jgi:apolipoprotein D and lipocalin family protein